MRIGEFTQKLVLVCRVGEYELSEQQFLHLPNMEPQSFMSCSFIIRLKDMKK